MVVEVDGPENLPFEEKDVHNYVTRYRRLKFEEGDAEALFQYLCEMQLKDINSFHVMDVDTRGHLRSVFLSNGRSRVEYGYFGDVVTFDRTHLTNKYILRFAPFVGLNHHRQSLYWDVL